MVSRQRLLEGSRAFVHPVRVRFASCVAGGRLYYPKMLDLFHDAYEALLEQHGVPLYRVLEERMWGAPLVHADIELLEELPTFGTPLDVVITAAEVSKHAVTFGYRVHETSSPKPLAIGTTVHAFLDLGTMKKRSVPDDVRAALGALSADAVVFEVES